MIRTHSRLALLAVSSATLAALAGAQTSLLESQGTIVATNGDPVPNAAGIPLPGITFGGAGALSDNPVVDETGRVFFRARLAGGTQTTTTERAYFYGASRADLRLVVRGGDAAPGMPAGVVLANSGGAVTPFNGNVRLSADGRMWWGTYLADPVNGSVGSTNDEAVFGGAFGAQALVARQGDLAPGTIGATFVQAFSSPNIGNDGLNREGRVWFGGTLTGGDVVGTANQGGLWSGLPGSIQLVARRGSPIPGLGGIDMAPTSNSIGGCQMNDTGALLYQALLSTTTGGSPATAANDNALLVHTPGAGNAFLVREGMDVPGTFGLGAFATLNAIAGDDWQPQRSQNAWTRNGATIFKTELRGGDVNLDLNDVAVCRADANGLAIVARRGMPAPGTNARFEDWNPNSLGITAAGRICFQATLIGGTSDATNDSGLWTGAPGALQLVVREGQVMPGTGGGIADHVGGSLVGFNDLQQILFNLSLVGGAAPGNSLWLYDPVSGLQPVVLAGDTLETSAGIFKTVSSFGWVAHNNGAGASLGFGHDGRIALRIAFADGTGAITTVRLPTGTSIPVPFCFGDGSGNACPCGNSGTTGNGCGNSMNPAGARITTSGVARLAADTLRLEGSGMPNSSALYLQGTQQLNGGLGAPFGDGLRCAGGTVVRLATKSNVGGASVFPAAGDPLVSVRGLVTAPGARSYQVWYRNSAAFCTSSAFNLTNGVLVTWAP